MDITATPVCIKHDLILAIMRSHPQFYLRIITAHDNMTVRCLDKISDPYRIVRFSRHILAIRLSTVKPSGIRRQCKEVRMQSSRHGISVFQITVYIGRLDLAPLTIFLYQRKKRESSGLFSSHHSFSMIIVESSAASRLYSVTLSTGNPRFLYR